MWISAQDSKRERSSVMSRDHTVYCCLVLPSARHTAQLYSPTLTLLQCSGSAMRGGFPLVFNGDCSVPIFISWLRNWKNYDNIVCKVSSSRLGSLVSNFPVHYRRAKKVKRWSCSLPRHRIQMTYGGVKKFTDTCIHLLKWYNIRTYIRQHNFVYQIHVIIKTKSTPVTVYPPVTPC
jgi:hypothetical protein